jgi:hypothetical protein
VCKSLAHTRCVTDTKFANAHCKPPQMKFWYTTDPDCTPLIAFVNLKSGGQQGKTVYQQLVSLLGEKQVFDLSNGGPTPGYVL